MSSPGHAVASASAAVGLSGGTGRRWSPVRLPRCMSASSGGNLLAETLPNR